MIISHKILHLEYDPTRDILFVEWPNFNQYALPELHYILDSLVETIRNYDISNLLVDARNTVVAINTQQYEEISGQFAKALVSTRLKKLARIVTDSTVREKQVQNFGKQANFSFEIQSFASQEEAMAWFDFE
ncbi:STAS/SEC14 domain-containing protein [Rufibacter roseus]|uniref:STAS/SEC14 domain-containing protein n=1 Tax=Rufibacter roseus TaxID=1567108 RepID=A0ABW2DKI5_9BACT|nr:STAS/SEC14 domain-containing protein [Rufibacter roseus]